MRRILREQHDAWQIYKGWQKTHASEIREGQKITSYGEFAAIYNESGRRIDRIKSEVRFQTSLKTYRALSRQYKEVSGGKPLARSARKLNTQEIAKMIIDSAPGNVILEFKESERQRFMQQGKSFKEANRLANLSVSQYFFGS